MNRFAVLAGLLLSAAACGLAQEPSSDPGTSGQGSSAQSSSSQGSARQNPPGQGSSSQGLSSQASSTQSSSTQDSPSQDSSSQPADRDREAEESSSRDTRTDISPPKDDAKEHPDSKEAVSDLVPAPPADASDVLEFHPWNPMKALKDIEVGDYYFKRKNYKAALDRYKEALYYKENDAVATYRTAVCEEKLGDKPEARKNFEQYLKILPEGPFAKDARASLEKLGGKGN